MENIISLNWTVDIFLEVSFLKTFFIFFCLKVKMKLYFKPSIKHNIFHTQKSMKLDVDKISNACCDITKDSTSIKQTQFF